LDIFAFLAEGALCEDNYFGMGVLLTTQGCKTGSKNYLEELIDEIKALG
jgi:hypothetical protein